MKANDFMTKNVVSCHEDSTIEEAATLMAENGFSVLPIVDSEDILVGIISESDFVGKEIEIPHAMASVKQLFGQSFYFRDVELIYAQSKKKKVSEIMSKTPRTITPETSLTSIINVMIAKGMKRLPVVENGKLAGIVTRKDILRAFNKLTKDN